jgi:hypothetical protein
MMHEAMLKAGAKGGDDDGAGVVSSGGMEGFVSLDGFCKILSQGKTEAVLNSRGVPVEVIGGRIGGRGGVLEAPQGPKDVADAISASLRFNGLTVEEGFAAFDVDKDGFISLEDLVVASATLKFGVEEGLLGMYISKYGSGSRGVDMVGWKAALITAEPETLLMAGGVKPER